jgi:hypothetical protein
MVMDHLLNSVGHIERLQRTIVNGAAQTRWVPVTDPKLTAIKCRLDLNFLRPGKDQPPPFEAGKAPDRIGLMFCNPLPIRAGDRIVADSGPVTGTFEIRSTPDMTITMRPVGHHLEIQIIETNQNLGSPT